MNRLGTIISQKGRLKSNTLLQWKVSAGQSQFSSLNVDGSAHGDVSFIMLLSLITSLLTWMCHLNGKTGNELFSSLICFMTDTILFLAKVGMRGPLSGLGSV